MARAADSAGTIFLRGEYSYRNPTILIISAAFLASGGWTLKLLITPPDPLTPSLTRWLLAILSAGFALAGCWILWWFPSGQRSFFRIDETGILAYGREYPWSDVAHIGGVRHLTGVHIYFRKRGMFEYHRVLVTSPPLSETQFAALCDRLENFTRASFPHLTIGRTPEESCDG